MIAYLKHALLPSLRPGAADRFAHSARPVRVITKSLKFIESYSLKRLKAQNPSKTEPCVTHGVPKRALCHPRGSQKGALVTHGGSKIDKNGSRDPFGTQVASRTATGPQN